MKLLDRYLLREMVVPFLIGQGAIVLMLTGSVLYNNADVLLVNQVPGRFVVRMILYFLPFLVHMTMPVAMAVAASLAVSRLGRDSEITVMRAAGVSLVRLFLPIFLTGLVVSLGDFVFGEYIVPKSVERFEAVLNEIPTHLKRLQPQTGQYIVSGDQSYAIFVQGMTPHHNYIELRGVQLISSPKLTYNGETVPFIVSAAHGRFQDGFWTLEHPYLLRYRTDGRERQESWPETFRLYIAVDPQVFQTGFLLQLPMWKMSGASSRTFVQLRSELRYNSEHGIRDYYTQLDYYFKLSVPFSCLVMALCCPPLALRFARGGGFMGTLLSICLVFVYWNTLLLARILGSPGAEGSPPLVAPQFAAWSQNVIFVLLGLIVLRKSE